MLELFNIFNKKTQSKDVAKDRLKMVLVQDRVNCSNQLVQALRNDILRVISNYMDIDEENSNIDIAQLPRSKGGATFIARIPIKKMRG